MSDPVTGWLTKHVGMKLSRAVLAVSVVAMMTLFAQFPPGMPVLAVPIVAQASQADSPEGERGKRPRAVVQIAALDLDDPAGETILPTSFDEAVGVPSASASRPCSDGRRGLRNISLPERPPRG